MSDVGSSGSGGLVPPSVVIVPGLGLDERSWSRVLERLTAPAAVVCLPALGRPAPAGTDVQIGRQAARLLIELARLGATNVVLVGHSAGCPVIVEAAARSTVVTGLVLLGPVTDPRAATWPRLLGQWVRTVVQERLWQIPLLIPQYRKTGFPTMLRGMNSFRWYRTDHAVARLTIPVAVVRGEQDRIAADAWSSRLADAARTDLTTVDGAAHMAPLTHPEAVVDAVREVMTRAALKASGGTTPSGRRVTEGRGASAVL